MFRSKMLPGDSLDKMSWGTGAQSQSEDSAMRVVPLDQIDHADGVADLAVGQNKDLDEKFIIVLVKFSSFSSLTPVMKFQTN